MSLVPCKCMQLVQFFISCLWQHLWTGAVPSGASAKYTTRSPAGFAYVCVIFSKFLASSASGSCCELPVLQTYLLSLSFLLLLCCGCQESEGRMTAMLR